MGAPPGGTPLDIAAVIDRVLRRNINFPILAVTAAGTTALTLLNRKVTVDATLGNITITLPSALAAGAAAGMDFEVKRLDAGVNTVTIQSAVGGQTIDGAASYSLSKQFASATFTSNGANYLSFYSPSLDMAVAISNILTKNIRFPFRTVTTSPDNILITDFYLAVNATGGARVLTLPSAVTVGAGIGYRIIRIDSTLTNAVTIGTTGGQTINGAASAAITLQYSVLDIVSDGANWLLFASPSAYASSTDVLWTFPGTVADDQDDNLYTLLAARAMAFVGFDVNLNLAPVGADLVVGWLVNGIVEPSAQVTVPAGDTDATVTFAISLAQGDTLQPYVAQVGSSTPGLTMVIRARGT